MRRERISTATKEYLMAVEMCTSYSSSSSDTLAQAIAIVSATATALAGNGVSSSPNRISGSVGREGPWRFSPSVDAAASASPPRCASTPLSRASGPLSLALLGCVWLANFVLGCVG